MSCVAHPSTLARKRRAREARAADRNADGPEDNPRRTACIAPSVDVASVLSHVFVRQFGLSDAWFVRSRGYDAIAVKNDVITSLHRMSKQKPRKKREKRVIAL